MPEVPGGNKVSDEDLSETYKILIGQLQFEGNLIWTRNQVFLILNSAIIAILSVSDQVKSNVPVIFAASFVGVVLCLLWLFTVERSRVYYQYWVTQTRALEDHLQSSTMIFETLHQANAGQVVKIGKHIFRMSALARFASISRITRLVAFAFIVVWIGLAVAMLAT
jgi:hypothetical protein